LNNAQQLAYAVSTLSNGKQKEVDQSQLTPMQQFAFAVQALTAGKSKTNPKKDRPLCAHCGGIGHTMEKCFKLHGYPPGHRKGKPIATVNQVGEQPQSSNSANGEFTHMQFQQMMAYMQQHMAQANIQNNPLMDNSTVGMSCSLFDSFSKPNSSTWIIDSCASSHICHNSLLFNAYTPLYDKFVYLPNHLKVQVMGSGSVNLGNHLTLLNVLHIPSFKVNLMSLSCLLSQTNYAISFVDNHCVIQDPQQSKMIGKGNLSNGLYLLEATHGLTQVTNKPI
jgi:hypothetical protein